MADEAGAAPSRAAVIFDAGPSLRHPRRFLSDLVHDVRISLDLAPQMARRQIVARYRRSVLGYLWLFLVPLSTAVAWLYVRASGAMPIAAGDASYPLYLLTGLFLWQGFVRMMNAPLQQVNASRAVVSKIRSPWEAIIAAGWVEALVELAIFTAVLALAIPFLGGEVGGSVIRAIAGTLALLLCGAAVGLVLVPLGLLFDDVPRAVGVATTFLFFVTPILYPPPTTALGRAVFDLNPVAVLLDVARSGIVAHPAVSPQLGMVWTAVSLVMFTFAWIVMRVAVPHLVARL